MYTIDKSIREEYAKAIKREYLLTRKYNKEDITKTIKEIYLSYTFVECNMSGRKNIQKEILSYLDLVAKEIFNFLNTHTQSLNEFQYDEFYFKITNNFLNTYNEYASKNGKVKELKYGMVQKLFNLTFKYLTLFEDYELYPWLFEYCHITITPDVLYYFRVHDFAKGIIAYREQNHPTQILTSYCMPSRNRSFSRNKIDLEYYKKLLNDYREKLKELYPAHSLLNCEFYIWKYVKEFREEDSFIFRLSKQY